MAKTRKDMTSAGPAADADSRQAILEAAARIMATKGFSGTSISMICKAAGCPASSLYWHFTSKENLFAEVVHWKAGYFFKQFHQGQDADGISESTIDQIAEQVGRSLQDDPLFLRFLLLLGLERKDMPDEVRKVIIEVRNSARLWWQAILEKQFANRGPTVARLVAEEYAEFGRSLIDGAFFAWDFGDGPDLRKVFRQLMVLLAALNEKIGREEAARPEDRT
ncbi:TetR family transcriptional regulator [Sphingobium jiangsuense]|uniref:AcrR family transcriptional regulator n=1 Tax=Sphingobium jiangsuense TaxID=870476 RepID=A0A7W6BFG8_9SPHN|nr:TetR/AcrR family transcriptional regulator [Sphingobium jiangsuense]MBB3926000.1 AcrR family transcriptional regulator [Sphingobium jiangsuense]GLS98932.1 TetR family transcriptional regulator [Sphingobium jiangsuense]